MSEEKNKELILNAGFNEKDAEKLAIDSAALLGRYFLTRQADGICITNSGDIARNKVREIAFSILHQGKIYFMSNLRPCKI